MYEFIKDNFQKSRGGYSRVLKVTCGICNTHITYYQKDGPGPLKRMYKDRFIDYKPDTVDLTCSKCKNILGSEYSYQKENRPAYLLVPLSFSKQIISKNSISH